VRVKISGEYTPIKNRLTILTRFTTNRSKAPIIIPGSFFKNGNGKARTAQTYKAIASIASHPRTICTENLGEEIDAPAIVVSWPRKANRSPDTLAIK
jgi:hypothetical protein